MDRLQQVGDDVYFVRGTAVNWVLLREGADVTLIDSGYPGDLDRLEASIRAIGSRPEAVRAILITHAHVDHMGAVTPFHERYGTPVYLDPLEVGHAKREYLDQLGTMGLLAQLWRPGVLPWALTIARAGATKDVAAPHATAFPAPGALDLPGRPVPVATHGHTAGHSSFHLPDAGIVVSGDALITGHEVSTYEGPQLTAPFFSKHHEASVAALDVFTRLDADVLLPGHGPLRRGSVAEAAESAKRREHAA